MDELKDTRQMDQTAGFAEPNTSEVHLIALPMVKPAVTVKRRTTSSAHVERRRQMNPEQKYKL